MMGCADFHHFAINKRDPIRISWHGNEDCFTLNQSHLLNALGNGVLTWQKEHKPSSLPLNIRFTPLLVPYNQSTIYTNSKNVAAENSTTNADFAFVHIYFINVGNFDEYRLNVRPEVSEWFANLNEANESHWIILFDTSKVAKDKKAKSQLLEKLKNDFARFQSRIFETSDLGNEKTLSAFSIVLRTTLFSSFENYTANLHSNLLKLKGTIKDNIFSPHSFINEQFQLVFFYWSLCLFDIALAELGELSSFLSDSIKALGRIETSELSPQWLKQLRVAPLDRHCPLLGVQMYSSAVIKDFSLVKLHAHLLSHQILLTVQNLQNRLSLAAVPSVQQNAKVCSESEQSRSQPASPSLKSKSQNEGKEPKVGEEAKEQQQLNTLQLRHNSVITVLRFSHDSIQRFEEDILSIKANFNATIFHCLILIWQAEIFRYCECLLSEGSRLTDVLSAAPHFNFLIHKKFEALRYLFKTMLAEKQSADGIESVKSSHQNEITRRWLDVTPLIASPKEIFATTNELQQQRQSALSGESVAIFRNIAEMICHAMDDDGDGEEKFAKFVQNALTEALSLFGQFGWHRHAYYVREQLAEMLIDISPNEAYSHICHNLRSILSNSSLIDWSLQTGLVALLANLVDRYWNELCKMGEMEMGLLFDCCLVALFQIYQTNEEQIEIEFWSSKLKQLANQSSVRILRSNLTWLKDVQRNNFSSLQFPIRIERTQSSLYCTFNSDLSFQLSLHNLLAIPLPNCNLKAIFRKITKENPIPQLRTYALHHVRPKDKENENQFFLECFPGSYSSESDNNSSFPEEFFDLQLSDAGGVTLPSKSTSTWILELKKVELSGYFYLDSLLVECAEFGFSFSLNYQEEMALNKGLDQTICLIDAIQPNIEFKSERDAEIGAKLTEKIDEKDQLQHVFLSGVDQQFWLALSPGTKPIDCSSRLEVSLKGTSTELMNFMDQQGNWVPKAEFLVEPLRTDQGHQILVRMCMDISKMEFHQSQESNGQIEKYEIKTEWKEIESEKGKEPKRFECRCFAVKFRPIWRLNWRTSMLAEAILFHLDICRKECGGSDADITIIHASLHQEQNIALEPVEATLLNPTPFKSIVASSTFHFIWRLPDSAAGNSIEIPHFLELKYCVKGRRTSEEDEEENYTQCREHVLRQRIDFPIQKVEYELCARFFSEQSQSVLCRIDQPADLVVSLRSLSKSMSEAETLIVSIESNNKNSLNNGYWHCTERHKLTKVKESGVGQAIFTVVPKQMGFLPFPAIALHKFNNAEHSPSRQHSINEKCFGSRLVIFYRNRANQIHILSTLQANEETGSMSSANTNESENKKKSLKAAAKDRIQKYLNKT